MWFRKKSRRLGRPLIFVCSPYRGDTETNMQNARRYCRLVVEQGSIPFAPHLLLTQFLRDDKAAERELGLRMGLEMLKLCDELWAFGEPTEGMRMEIAQAMHLGSVRVGKVKVYWRDNRLLIRLPSGRDLCYLSPRFVTNRFGSRGIGYLAASASGKMELQETFGGKIVENCTQSIARDLLAHAMQNLEAAGYPIVFHVHDEAVMEAPIGQGSVEEACRIMAIPPDWARDLPLRADGEEMEFYRK